MLGSMLISREAFEKGCGCLRVEDFGEIEHQIIFGTMQKMFRDGTPCDNITLMDALGKRVAFLKEVVAALGLNADCVHARCEDAAKKPEFRDTYDVACARAVAETNVLSEWLLPFVKPGGRMLALKGPMAAEEAERAQTALAQLNGRPARVCPVSVPGRDWDHRVIEILKTGATPDRFPRRAGIAEKRPLK